MSTKKILLKAVDCLLVAIFAALGCAAGLKLWEMFL